MADTEHLDDDKRCTLFDKPQRYCVAHMDWHAENKFEEHCERYTGASPIRLCANCGEWHPLNMWGSNCMPEPNWNRSELASPGIISDTLPDIMNPLTGMPISSKSELRKQYKAAGVEEVGNEGIRTHPSERVCVPETPDRVLERQVAETVKQSLSQLTTDSLSNDQMANMLRAPAPKNDLGLAVE